MRRRTVVFLSVGLLAGGAVTALSGFLGSWDRDWWESVFANGGVTLFLAVPVAILLARLSGSIDSVGRTVSTIRTDVEQAKADIQDLREESSRAAADIASRNDRIFSADSTDLSPQRIVDLIRIATEQKLISSAGYRVAVDQFERRYVRFSSIGGLTIFSAVVEDHAGLAEFSRATYSASDVGVILGEIHGYLLENGHQPSEPFEPVQNLIRQLDNLRKLRIRESDLVGDVQESTPGNWFVADSGVFHTAPTYEIRATSLKREGMSTWINRLQDKGWVDYDDAFYAIRTGYALLIESEAPPLF